MRVKEWMTTNPITVRPSTSVLNARRLQAHYGVRYLPVVTADDRLLGILTTVDILAPEHHVASACTALEWDLLIGRYRAAETVMRKPVALAHPEDDLVAAAQTMLAQRTGALPVVHRGVVVGMLTASDCLRALLYSHARQETRERPVEVDPDDFKATPLEQFA